MPSEEIPDTELLNRVYAGDTACYGELIGRHHGRLYRVAQRVLRNEADAEDALQEAYLHSFCHLKQFEGRSTVLSWLTRIAQNEAFTQIRKRPPCRSLEESLSGQSEVVRSVATPDRDPEQQAINRQLEEHLAAAVASLPKEYQEVFSLREIEGANTGEAAARLEISESCLKIRLFRAKKLLRDRLSHSRGGIRRAGAAGSVVNAVCRNGRREIPSRRYRDKKPGGLA
jgi:RNA polymerase sigma-70 factor (ECF subfamily)